MKKQKTSGNPSEHIGIREQISFGLMCGGEGLGTGMVDSFIQYFMTNIASITSGISGIILMISKIADFFTDALMGSIVDRTKHKNGKAKPWLLRAIIPYSVGLILCFSAPFTNKTATIIWAFITYTLCTAVGFTMYYIPQNSMVALSSPDPIERNKYQFAYVMGKLAFIIVASITVQPMTEIFGGGRQGWLITAIIYGIVCAILHAVGYLGVKERVIEVKEEEHKNVLAEILQAWKSALSNKYMLISFGCMFLGSLNTMTVFVTYYCQYVINNMQLIGVIFLLQLLPNIAGQFALKPLIPRLGKRNVNILGGVIMLVGSVLAIIFNSNFSMLVIALILCNLGVAASSATMLAIVADAIDFEEWKTGVRNTGTYYSTYNCINKIASALKSVVAAVILTIGGYIEGNVATQPVSALLAIKVGFLWVPAACALLTIVVFVFYDLDKKMPQISADLKARRDTGESE